MKTSSDRIPRFLRLVPGARRGLVIGLVFACAACTAWSQVTDVGGIARDFTVVNRANYQPVHLYDLTNRVVVLDFFAYWCGPCQASSPDVEQNIKRYYEARGGNAHGVPVEVVAVNIESGNEAATDQFIASAGLEFVVNDYTGVAYNQFSLGGIPLFVILNGVDRSPSHAQWEVLYRMAGYAGAPALRAVIDAVEPALVSGPPIIQVSPADQMLAVGDTLQLSVVAAGSAPLRYQWYRDNEVLPGATGSTYQHAGVQQRDGGAYVAEVANDLGTNRSAPAHVRVFETGNPVTYAYTGPAVTIPDANPAGITSVISVPDALNLLRAKVSVRITHPFRGDLRVVLQLPSGTEVVLKEPGNDSGADVILADLLLPGLAGASTQGNWRLRVIDGYAQDVGRLEAWSIELTPARPSVSEAFAAWIGTFPALGESQRGPGADPDGDGLPNLLEYALDGHSPSVAGAAPVVERSAAPPGTWEYVLAWRTGVDVSNCRVYAATELSGASWTEVVAGGGDIGLDPSDPGRWVVRWRADLPRVFLQLRMAPGGW